MKLSFLLAVCLANVIPASAQRWFDPLVQVKQFLQLTDSQVQTILTNNDEYNRWSSEKQTRIQQVQTEIIEETDKERLDANALGVRYVEIETICREMTERAGQFRSRNVTTLSAEQKTKLKVLEDAVKLAPVISDAQSANLTGAISAPYGYTSNSSSFGSSLIGYILGPAYGCTSPAFGGIVRQPFPANAFNRAANSTPARPNAAP